jgi:crossover junction endodeoxyribonuclease RuvC
MKVLALDPGYGRCGIAVCERLPNGQVVLLQSDCITTNPKDPFEVRLHSVVSVFREWIQTHQPDVCAFERLFFTKNQKTAMRVAEARGAFILTAEEAGIPIHEYGPGEIKVAVTGDGRASKKQICTMVHLLVKPSKKITHDDEYDAIAVALTACASIRGH